MGNKQKTAAKNFCILRAKKQSPEEFQRAREEREFRQAVELGERMAFKERLEKEHGLENHPKKDRLWALAWEYGHSAGNSEVEMHYGEFADLLK